jgi:hypothetical protein
MTVTINIPSQLPALTGNANLFLRVNAGENGIEWAAAAGGGITIGTTAIASGTVGRVLFEGAGNVVQQSANFFWDNTNSRLGIRVATPTASLEVLGAAASGTGQAFAVHNSVGNNNALIVTNDGRIGIRTNAPVSTLNVVNQDGSSVGTLVTLDGLATVSGTNFHNNRLEFRNVTQTVFGRMFTYSGGQFNGLWLDAGANTSQVLLRQSGGVIISGANSGVSGDLSTLAQLNTVSSGSALTIYNASPTQNTSLRIFSPVNTINANLGGFQNYALSSTNVARRYTQNYLQIVTNTNGNESGDMYWRLIHSGVESDRLVLKGNGNLLLGTTTDVASSILTLQSTTKGFLPPRMTGAQAEAIATPAEGLMVYATNAGSGDITAKGWWGYDGTNWVQLN